MYSKIFNMAFSTIFNKYIYLIKALLIYTIISIGVDYINLQNIIYIDGEAQTKSTFIAFMFLFLTYLVYVMVAITTHRILILGEDSIPQWGIYKFTKREWRFFINAIIIGLILSAIAIPIFLLGIPFKGTGTIISIVLIAFVFSIIFSRFSLIFPIIAIDKEITLTDAWNFTKQYKLLVFVTVIVFPFLFSIIFGFVYGIAIEFLARLTGLDLFFLTSILNIIITVFTVSALSATYKLISKEHPEYFIPQSEKDKIIKDTMIEDNHHGYKITIDDKDEYNFLQLKDKIHLQYFDLGFDETVVDKEGAWMIRNSTDENKAYISLTHINGEYVIEIYRAPMVDFINQL